MALIKPNFHFLEIQEAFDYYSFYKFMIFNIAFLPLFLLVFI